MSAFVAPIIGKCDNCGAELRSPHESRLDADTQLGKRCPICGSKWSPVKSEPTPDPHADLRAALNAACEAGTLHGWRVYNPDKAEATEWVVSMTTKQAEHLARVIGPHCSTCCGGGDAFCREHAIEDHKAYVAWLAEQEDA